MKVGIGQPAGHTFRVMCGQHCLVSRVGTGVALDTVLLARYYSMSGSGVGMS